MSERSSVGQLDIQYENLNYTLPQISHHYGENVHILSDPYLLNLLAKLCQPESTQPFLNHYVEMLYHSLLEAVIASEFKFSIQSIPTRMTSAHPSCTYRGPALEQDSPIVCVNLARAGTLPSHICYSLLNYLLPSEQVRQDHISISRTTNENQDVTGSTVTGHKVGGSVDGSIVLLPDPMGATGSTLKKTLELYSEHGQASLFIGMHLVVTPEYLKLVKNLEPSLRDRVRIYTIRLDRGLSDTEVLRSEPGKFWDREKGLNSQSYIVPGAGGVGEVLNNAYV